MFGLVVAIIYRITILPCLLIPVGCFYCHIFYRYNWYSIDFCNMAVAPISRNQMVNRIILAGLLEYGTLLWLAYFAVVMVVRIELLPMMLFFMLGCSIISSAIGVKLKRHNGIRLLSGIMGGIGTFVSLMLLHFIRGDQSYKDIFLSLDTLISEHWLMWSLVSMVILAIVGYLSVLFIRKEIEAYPFVSREVIANNIKYVRT